MVTRSDELETRKAALRAAVAAASAPRGAKKLVVVIRATSVRLRLVEDGSTISEGAESGGGSSE